MHKQRDLLQDLTISLLGVEQDIASAFQYIARHQPLLDSHS